MGLFESLERFFAGHATAAALREQVELAEARQAATDAKVRDLEANLQAAKARCSLLEAEKHFLQVQVMQAQQRPQTPLDHEAA
jgi:hypothetical protein